ncbi:cell division protein FtsL [Paenibacillus spongiae]|uniref:Cell division protein FtsL n=1 Tax=Paenibacillus spongiae TaxID=2909671 RepID=A0ABY5SEW1_9BACL|nr:cell division protein FtsL [Paenibacillus spongiae]UVI32189.1 cell division protein FtsL [Paenibacillus spongiae]
MAYQNGNLALQPKRKPEEQVYREKRTVVVKRKPLPVQEKLLWLFTIIVGVLVAGIIIFRYAETYKLNIEVRNLTNQYNEMAVEMKELEKQVQVLGDPDRINKIAKSMNMSASKQDVMIDRKEQSTEQAPKE